PAGVGREQRLIERFVRHDFFQAGEFLLSLGRLPLTEKRSAARVMPHPRKISADLWRLRLAQHLVPFSKTRQRVIRHDAEAGQQGNWFQGLVGDSGWWLGRRFDRHLAVAFSS